LVRIQEASRPHNGQERPINAGVEKEGDKKRGYIQTSSIASSATRRGKRLKQSAASLVSRRAGQRAKRRVLYADVRVRDVRFFFICVPRPRASQVPVCLGVIL